MGKVVCFGELLLRLVPSGDGSWLSESKLPVYVGGAEANVAVALSKWGIPTSYFTCVPENILGEQVIDFLRKKEVDTSSVKFSGQRMGIYYIPEGADLKNSGVIYDRANSSFSNLKKGMVDWEKVLDGADWFHFSAINPALNKDIAEVCEEALKVAKRKELTISVDLNYRAKLWQYGKRPSEVMPELVEYCDLVMGNIWAAEMMLGIPLDQDLLDQKNKLAYLEQARKTSSEILKEYKQCKAVANTFRFTGENEKINYYAALYKNGHLHSSTEYNTDTIVDKVGSGDCFMAGLIYGLKQNISEQDVIDFATAAAFQKLFVKGDSTDKSIEEIKKSIKTI